MKTEQEIQKKIIECIDEWEAEASGNPFSWVDDRLITYTNYDIYYDIHCAWVTVWNESGRIQPMNVFLRKWNTIENIANALEVSKK